MPNKVESFKMLQIGAKGRVSLFAKTRSGKILNKIEKIFREDEREERRHDTELIRALDIVFSSVL